MISSGQPLVTPSQSRGRASTAKSWNTANGRKLTHPRFKHLVLELILDLN